MLVIVSDLHMVDGTCTQPVSAAAYQLFADRLNELAVSASWRGDQTYRPLETMDILLMGDILDPLHSLRWLEDPNASVRPWSNIQSPEFADKLHLITQAILQRNQASVRVLQDLSQGKLIHLLPADRRGHIAFDTRERLPVKVRLHYMVGNHDWYYHLPGDRFNVIRQEVINALGLTNSKAPFPHQAIESPSLKELLASYSVFARHGDIFDFFNFDPRHGRDYATIGDAFSIEVGNRFTHEVARLMGDEVLPGVLKGLGELANVRPTLMVPVWISSQLRQFKVPANAQRKIKSIWDDLCHQFLGLDIVREADQRFKFDAVDALEALLGLSRHTSFQTMDQVVTWVRDKFNSGHLNFARNVLGERSFLGKAAQYFVYGHTHHHEVVPLDSQVAPGKPPFNQIYFNTGTWHTFYDLALNKVDDQKFIPYQVLSYAAFFSGDQRGGRRFETWSGAFSG